MVEVKENYSIRVVKVSFPSTTFYESQILRDNEVEFSRIYKNKYYAISKAKQFDTDLVWYKDVKLLNEIIK